MSYADLFENPPKRTESVIGKMVRIPNLEPSPDCDHPVVSYGSTGAECHRCGAKSHVERK